MPKKSNKQEIAHEFRGALISDRSKAERFLSVHPDLIDHPVYGDSETALHYFAVENQAEIVKWLLVRGANPNGISENKSPLSEAAQLGYEEVCRLLVEAGANQDFQDFLEETPLHKASASGCLSVVRLLLANGADPSIREGCGRLPVDLALPRKREQVCAAFAEFSNTP